MQGSKFHCPWWKTVSPSAHYSPFSWSCSNRAVTLCSVFSGRTTFPFRLLCCLNLCFLRVKCLSIGQFPISDHFCCLCHFLNLMLAGLLVRADKCKFSTKGKTWCYSLLFAVFRHYLILGFEKSNSLTMGFVLQQGEVRLGCLLVLQGLYCSPESASQMELFTSRFKVNSCNMSH